MAITKDTVKYVAHLARIKLLPKELEKLADQLEGIIGFIDKLKKLEVRNVITTSHILPINNVLRDDNLQGSLPRQKVLENTQHKEEGFFSVPKVIE